MPSPFNVIGLLAVISSLVGSTAAFTCRTEGTILNCSVSHENATISTVVQTTNSLSETRIFYNGTVNLELIVPSSNAIVIQAVDPAGSSSLQIRRLETNASRIDVKIILSPGQISTPLFSASSTLNLNRTTVAITIKQLTQNIDSFRIFESPSTASKVIRDYQIIFDKSSTAASGQLLLQNFVGGLAQVSAITISGNNHTLITNSSTTPYPRVEDLTLKSLSLSSKILDLFVNASSLTIEECRYNRGAQFLQSSTPAEISLTMRNNIPLDAVLPGGNSAFTNSAVQYKSITLIEPSLNSSCLKALSNVRRSLTVTVELGDYQTSDFVYYQSNGPAVPYLTIRNLRTLDTIPSKFFAQIDNLQRAVLAGPFRLRKSDLCPFVGIPIQGDRSTLTVTLETSPANLDDSNPCARTYIDAINVLSQSSVECPGGNSKEACERWASETNGCDLVSYESSQCSGTVPSRGPTRRFYFNGSYVQQYLDAKSWRGTTTRSPGSKDDEKLDYRPIIGALVGLLVAITVLTVTIFCIRRFRRNERAKYVPSAPGEKQMPPSAYDMTHVSIATSKTSKSSARALEKSFFPVQPNDEIAPPLYTAPSEAVASVSPYHVASAPPKRRDSVATHATHVYETLDS